MSNTTPKKVCDVASGISSEPILRALRRRGIDVECFVNTTDDDFLAEISQPQVRHQLAISSSASCTLDDALSSDLCVDQTATSSANTECRTRGDRVGIELEIALIMIKKRVGAITLP